MRLLRHHVGLLPAVEAHGRRRRQLGVVVVVLAVAGPQRRRLLRELGRARRAVVPDERAGGQRRRLRHARHGAELRLPGEAVVPRAGDVRRRRRRRRVEGGVDGGHGRWGRGRGHAARAVAVVARQAGLRVLLGRAQHVAVRVCAADEVAERGAEDDDGGGADGDAGDGAARHVVVVRRRRGARGAAGGGRGGVGGRRGLGAGLGALGGPRLAWRELELGGLRGGDLLVDGAAVWLRLSVNLGYEAQCPYRIDHADHAIKTGADRVAVEPYGFGVVHGKVV